MKKYTYQIEVTVYGESDEDARDIFCCNPDCWDFDESELVLLRVEDPDLEPDVPMDLEPDVPMNSEPDEAL